MDIVGNIIIKNKERLKYLLLSFQSLEDFSFFNGFYLNIENGSNLNPLIKQYLQSWTNYGISNRSGSYGNIYSALLNNVNSQYYLHFEEDHFCVLEEPEILYYYLRKAKEYNVSLIKASFFDIENESFNNVEPIYEDDYCRIFNLNKQNFEKLQKGKFGKRFYTGNNSIFEINFAKRYWSRNIKNIHGFEIKDYGKDFHHNVLIPKSHEILRSIDDDHGNPNSCLLKKPTVKFERCLEKVNSIDLSNISL